MPKFYGAGRWDPKLIMLQMICMQTSHYIARGLFLLICHGVDVSMDQFFAYHTQTIATVDGIKNCFAVLAAGFVSAVCMCFFVERAKKCLDFGVTLYFVDFLIQCFYSEFPKTWEWWILHVLTMVLTIVLGEYLCSRRELEEIPMIDLFTTKRPSRP
ncbi:hypothetical protein Poli38472_008756 [Pythium oligandrum]|uniref:Protein SYS1 homolog n=1 Tax=Pythium oligandrum TaxID=41045 RepID=A0A8K1C4C6_PYTOL|nr:hypothetical protein Poli38472_008756 [Pythium oligandrum]|eukprot:TMW56108.1 hypothetical protein Poli38472_008756 [Pythium oligandrum]